MASHCTHLHTLDLYLSRYSASPEVIVHLARGCNTNLKHLFLSQCKDVNEHVVTALADFCPNLESLYLNGCAKLTFQSLSKVTNVPV